MTDPSLHGPMARDCMLQSNRFLSHTPLPEFWAQQHPTVTVFRRSLMKFNMLTDLWDKWIFVKGASVWTDVTPEINMLFFQDLLVLVKHSLVGGVPTNPRVGLTVDHTVKHFSLYYHRRRVCVGTCHAYSRLPRPSSAAICIDTPTKYLCALYSP